MSDDERGYGARQLLPSSSVFAKVGRDLTREAAETGTSNVPSGHPHELEQMELALGRRTKSSVLLLGEHGVGKSFLARALAARIVAGDVPPWLKDRKVIATSINDTGLNIRAEADGNAVWNGHMQTLHAMLKECREHRIILFWDEFQTVFHWPISVSILKPALASGELSLVAATTTSDYHRLLAQNETLMRRFETVYVTEMGGEELWSVLRDERDALYAGYGARISDKVIDLALQLGKRYAVFLQEPDRSIDVLERVTVSVVSQHRKTVTVADVQATVARMAHVPVALVAGVADERTACERALKHRVVGQDHIAESVARTLFVTRSGLAANLNRPLGVILLSGPSGVGKTELAKALSAYLTGSDDNLIRLDMSLYQTPWSMEQLLGRRSSDPQENYVPDLTRRVRSNPYAVLLLDEFEKADRSVWELFLQAFDYGYLTDYLGNRVNLRNAVILMTCNIGFEPKIRVGIGVAEPDSWETVERDTITAVERVFPRELIGRMDGMLVFKQLSVPVMKEIVRKHLTELGERAGKSIEMSEEAADFIVRGGFSAEYGARRLAFFMDSTVGLALASLKQADAWSTSSRVGIVLEAGKVAAAPIG
jgi:ATP-dependent Clp protease ATP-binding subunit ClpA